nr:reverse transcriptase domain-containing protein [Tanacetum cinerariifolium]
MANTTPLVTTVMKPTSNPGEANTAPRVNIQELCEEYYEDILPIIMEKARHERLKDVHARSRPQKINPKDSLRGRSHTRTLGSPRDDRNRGVRDFHSTDECMQLKRQIEELVRAGKLSHLIKEIKQGREQPKTGRKETAAKDKPTTIYMVRSWQRTVKQKITQSFEQGKEITFPPLANSNGTEGPLVIKAEIGGHTIHRMYIDGGIVTIHSSLLIPAKCALVNTSSVTPGEKKAHPTNLMVPLHPNFLDQEVVVGGSLSDKGRIELCALLKRNLDIFVWQPSDITGVPRAVAEYRLNIREGYLPIRQKKSGQAPERTKAIQAEVEKLVEAGIMREVYYHDWLSNPVMVKKYDGSWRMCVDFTDLNKAYLQDCYPLPEIDWKVESLCGNPFKCFLDAYKGYHQIQMLAADEEKTAFHTGQRVYCYTKMPFGLKNAAPKPQEELIMYMSATHGAISAVLLTERETVQTPVYFISRALQGPKLNYSPMEKLVLSLVFAAKRLRRYFQAHPIAKKKAHPTNLTVPLHPNFLDQEVVVGGSLSDKGRTELCALLKRNLDIFAWQPSDMTRVPRSVAEHRLNVREGYPPIRQKKRRQATECTKAIQAEVKKLVEAGIMREVYHNDWLSNPVMVKKHDGSWRMCVDFTDLNKACPQDCYPLPEIDWKVESLCGYPFKCFLDAYKGYHQIQMAAADEEKTAFLTGQGVYCYTKMPFGLKNAAEGVFLGYVITPEGIKLCPDKTSAVLQLPSPQTIKEVQSINGKLASLNSLADRTGDDTDASLLYKPCVTGSGTKLLTNGKAGIITGLCSKKASKIFSGTSYRDGSGAGLILTNPDGVEFTYALRFQFAASNNEAEYKALITGLRIATQMGVKNIQANVDSKLVAN